MTYVTTGEMAKILLPEMVWWSTNKGLISKECCKEWFKNNPKLVQATIDNNRAIADGKEFIKIKGK